MQIFDLTQPLSAKTPRSSDHPEVEFKVLRWYSRNGVCTRTITASLHSGTHLDTAALYFPDGMTVDQIPLDSICGSAVILDIPKGEWGEITPEDLAAATPRVEPGDIVVLHTGWHRYHQDEERYILRGPGLIKSAVDWLIDRGINAICSDTPSPEHPLMRLGQWRTLRPDIFGTIEVDPAKFPPHYAHKAFLPRGIIMIESLGGQIEELLGQRVTLFALPPKYVGVEAAQARVIAIR